MNKPTAGRQWTALILLLAGLIVAGSIAAVAAFGGEAPIAPAPSVDPTSAPVVTPEPSQGPVVTPAPEPSDEPTAEPTAKPEPTAEPEPTDGVDAMPITVDLETLTPHDVTIDIVDDTFSVVDAVSGTPSASASVEPYTLKVENIDPRTLRLTWVDRPGDNRLALYIDREANRFLMVQPEHDTQGDTVVHDRVLILTFRDAIDADDIETFLQEGLDTPG
jgi:hypothetical protein